MLFSFTNNPERLNVYGSARNPQGISCLCPSSDNSLLAFPSALAPGSVACVNLGNMEQKPRTLAAHVRPLAALALNSTGMAC